MGASLFCGLLLRGGVRFFGRGPGDCLWAGRGSRGPDTLPAPPGRPAGHFLPRADGRVKQKTPCSEEQGVYSGCSCQARTDDIVINSHALYRLS